MDGTSEARLALEQRRLDILEQMHSTVVEITAIIEASADSNADDEHDPEGSTIAFERAQAAALLRESSDQLEEVDQALARLASGRYGICEVCGEPIATARLTARPAARTCIDCATAHRLTS